MVPQNVLLTLREGSELSYCMGDRHTDSENDEDNYEKVVPDRNGAQLSKHRTKF